jgi:hypothetical protein
VHIDWIDDQPNIAHQQPCDQRATVNGRTAFVRYDYAGQDWFAYIEPADPPLDHVSTRSHPTRDAARGYAEDLLRQHPWSSTHTAKAGPQP